MYETIVIEKRGPIGVISLNRPQKLNSFSSKMAEELDSALRQLDKDTETRVVIVRGEGKAFSTGIDVSEFRKKALRVPRVGFFYGPDAFHRCLHVEACIAMVHGYAVANGAGLMAAADFAIVAEGTQIGTTAINVGLLCTGPIIPMSYSLGKKKTPEMLLMGEMMDAKEAQRLGLVNKGVPAERLEEETFAFARKLIDKSSIALQMGKEFYYQMIDMPFQQRFVLHRELMVRLCTTENAHKGIKAFVEKRKPLCKGK